MKITYSKIENPNKFKILILLYSPSATIYFSKSPNWLKDIIQLSFIFLSLAVACQVELLLGWL